ncbi:helix-turn-helix domain-containing protein [Burkholderia sp. BKH01]|uniref:helix-turn-helix domain-containing protein n=1 Tax=Burkholderia sp. BKH01 TaxID=2769262 RepID=UPI0021DFD734|nr:helix-turn-helix domain-containing protein [Burkholderia sp. BKH01]
MLGLPARARHRAFRRETVLSFRRWREQARRLLAHRGKVLTIAMDHGYSSQSALSAMFKQHLRVSPSMFYA